MKAQTILGWSGALAVSALLVTSCGDTTASGAYPPGATRPSGSSGSGQNSSESSSRASSSSSSSSSSGSGAAACTILTQSDSTSILGSDAGPGTDTSSGSTSSCTYGGAVTLAVDHTGSRQVFDTLCHGYQSQAGFQTVSGVGDAACMLVIAGSVGTLYFIKGSDFVQIVVQGGLGGAKINSDALITVGKSVAGKL